MDSTILEPFPAQMRFRPPQGTCFPHTFPAYQAVMPATPKPGHTLRSDRARCNRVIRRSLALNQTGPEFGPASSKLILRVAILLQHLAYPLPLISNQEQSNYENGSTRT